MAAEGRVRPLRPRGLCLIVGNLLGLLLGLSGCGNSTPEAPTSLGSHEAPAPASTASDGTGAEGNATAQWVAAQPSAGPPADAPGTVPPATSPSEANPQAVSREQLMRGQWYATARESPDITVRLQALETWAQQPGDSIDPVTYALVDEDESVRARAQELYGQRLAWEAATPVPTEQAEQWIERSPDRGRE